MLTIWSYYENGIANVGPYLYAVRPFDPTTTGHGFLPKHSKTHGAAQNDTGSDEKPYMFSWRSRSGTRPADKTRRKLRL